MKILENAPTTPGYVELSRGPMKVQVQINADCGTCHGKGEIRRNGKPDICDCVMRRFHRYMNSAGSSSGGASAVTAAPAPKRVSAMAVDRIAKLKAIIERGEADRNAKLEPVAKALVDLRGTSADRIAKRDAAAKVLRENEAEMKETAQALAETEEELKTIRETSIPQQIHQVLKEPTTASDTPDYIKSARQQREELVTLLQSRDELIWLVGRLKRQLGAQRQHNTETRDFMESMRRALLPFDKEEAALLHAMSAIQARSDKLLAAPRAALARLERRTAS